MNIEQMHLIFSSLHCLINNCAADYTLFVTTCTHSDSEGEGGIFSVVSLCQHDNAGPFETSGNFFVSKIWSAARMSSKAVGF